MAEICPEMMSDVMIPGHFVSVFANQNKYRKTKSVSSSSPTEKLRGNSIHNDITKMTSESLRENQELDDELSIDDVCTDLPFYNMYLAEDSFQTDLHIDAHHSSFMASMCVGRKLWRVMTNQDFGGNRRKNIQ